MLAAAASPDRITRPIDVDQLSIVPGHIHHLALPQYDLGPVDDSMRMDSLLVLFKPSSDQQTRLDVLLADQQNPSSPMFHKWLSPEEFGSRFGFSAGDNSRVVAWLQSQGLQVRETARGRNWISFGGTAAQVSTALHTSIHRFQVNGEAHYANVGEPSVPSALSEVIGGFLGLHDFHPQPMVRQVTPDYSVSSTHYLAPQDFATIYDLNPLYQSGVDGTGQSIVVVGESDVVLSDIAAFRSRYKLPANVPKLVLYDNNDPGVTTALMEADLDLEWAGAIAPNATIYYFYGTNAFTAMAAAVNANAAPVISVSFGGCEVGWRPTYWRSVAQQANAQGITILAASDDSGAAGCDPQEVTQFASRGPAVSFPAVLPEVTAVGGTQFVEGTGNYWAATNSSAFGSALSYIPEAAWNETNYQTGLGATGGGASAIYSKPSWQTGTGVPDDGARDVPDVALSAASHDAYLITFDGMNGAAAGTSCSTPAMAGIVALLNQYQVSKGYQKLPGLGNINPQLYRLAQSAPSAFHDIISGNNIVPCLQASPGCTTGSFGYLAGVGYDLATGLGSVDGNNLITQWNTRTNGVVVTLSLSAAKATVNDTVQTTATVAPASGSGTPTGTVDFSANGVPLGSVVLQSQAGLQTATVSFPLYLLGTGTYSIVAQYSGDPVFSSGGATAGLQIKAPTGAAAIVPVWPNTVWPNAPPDARGLVWETQLVLLEAGGVGATITGFTIDGVAQPLTQYFPSPSIPANGSVSTVVLDTNLTTPVTRVFGFSGTDATGHTWSRQVPVAYLGLPLGTNFNLTATPVVINRDPSADPSCQWSTRLAIDDLGGNSNVVTNLYLGSADMSAQIPAIFGTPRLEAWGSLQGKLCFPGVTPPASDFIAVYLNSEEYAQVNVSFAPAPPNPATISVAPSAVTLAAAPGAQVVQGSIQLDLSDKTQYWTATILPTNRGAGWLHASQLSGTGPAQIILVASGAGYEPGAYRALMVFESAGAAPQTLTLPIMFVLGASNAGTKITAVTSAASSATTGSPGMLMSVYGTKLGGSSLTWSGFLLPFSLGGVSATVNGVPAPLLYVSPGQINLQIPFEVGAGPAVLGINNNGQVAGFLFQMAASSPSVGADAAGNLLPKVAVHAGGSGTLYFTGGGDVTPRVPDGQPFMAQPLLPVSVTIGGIPAYLQYVGLAPGLVGTFQVNFVVPASVPPGPQPVVVTVGGNSSPPVSLTIQ